MEKQAKICRKHKMEALNLRIPDASVSLLICMYLFFKTQWKLKKNISFIKDLVAVFS